MNKKANAMWTTIFAVVILSAFAFGMVQFQDNSLSTIDKTVDGFTGCNMADFASENGEGYCAINKECTIVEKLDEECDRENGWQETDEGTCQGNLGKDFFSLKGLCPDSEQYCCVQTSKE